MNEAIKHVDKRLTPFKPSFIREINRDDILRLMEIRMARILRFNSEKADNNIAQYRGQIEEINVKLENLVDYTISWFLMLKEKYGKDWPRKTTIRSFETIEASKVVVANEKLYINRSEGFIGTSLKKDEYIAECSHLDDVIVFFRDGKYKVVKISDKVYVGKNILYANVFKRNDKRTIYNVIYRSGKLSPHYIKRFAVPGVTRDREYDLTRGKPGSRIAYFSANPNGEAETVKVYLKPKPRMRVLTFEEDFSEIAIRGRGAMGNILTKSEVHKITLKEKGVSTLGGRKVWFDSDVFRLNYEERGIYLGEFHGEDRILVVLKNGDFYTSNFDLTQHFSTNILKIEKFKPEKIWTAALYDADQKYSYLKRFTFEDSERTLNFLGDNPDSTLLLLSDVYYSRIKATFGGEDEFRDPIELDADEFIGIKSHRAKGKRISNYEVAVIEELEPLRFPEVDEEEEVLGSKKIEIEYDDEESEIDIKKKNKDDKDEIEGQMKLF